tara:strand:+ start:1347 stop:1463 length:117 start_codon:yes stop_codon:yes gene_type:complete
MLKQDEIRRWKKYKRRLEKWIKRVGNHISKLERMANGK